MPEGTTHLVLRTFLWRLLEFALGREQHTVGSEQFIYWNGSNPKRALAPDVFVCLGIPKTSFGSWKTWERRTPDLAIEIISPTENDAIDWDEKFARYRELGIGELVRFDPMAPEGQRLRIWDRVEHDLVEREVRDDTSPCLTLGLNWVITPVEDEPVGLRVAKEDGTLVLNEQESERAARLAAEARIRELEEELRRRS